MGDDFELKQKCKKLQEYNGWTNYETWATALHIDNEYEIYQEAIRMGKESVKNAKKDENVKEGIWTECEAAKFRLADKLKDKIEDENPLIEDVSFYGDILGANLKEIDWHEIAEHYLPEDTCKIKKK